LAWDKTPLRSVEEDVDQPTRACGPLSRETLEGAQRRDPEALGELFERHADRIYDLAYRLLGERAAAEDAMQEVFLKIYRGVPKLDIERDPAPWVLRVTQNVCRDVWRSAQYRASRRSRPIHEEVDSGLTLAAHSADPEQAMLKSERERLVQEAIMRLPPTLRVVVVLHEYMGLPHQEVADIVGASHTAVRKRHSRALAKLGRFLKGTLS
jgi:RNA polymerase sigma-70 factor (ECF subfamily)